MPSSSQSDIQKVVDSGLEPFVLTYETVHQFSSRQTLLRSLMNIQSLDLGLLTPAEYRYVARRSKQGQQLFRRHLQKLMADIPGKLKKSPFIKAFTLPAYGKMIKDGSLGSILFEELAAHSAVSADMLCVEISADLLFEDLPALVPELQRVQNMGISIAIWEFGDSFCPLLRLPQVPHDYIMLDPHAFSLLDGEKDEYFRGLCNFLHTDPKVKVFAPDLADDSLLSQLEALGCDGYSLSADAPPAEQEDDL